MRACSSRFNLVLVVVGSLLLVAQASTSSLDTICAAPTCLFKNGSACDRVAAECPRCVRFDTLLNASICTPLQSNGSGCAANYTLCPETPLDTTGDDDEYEWIELGSAASGSASGSGGCAGCEVAPDATATPAVPRTVATAPPPKAAIAADAAPEHSEAASRQTESSGPAPTLPTWLVITIVVIVVVGAVPFTYVLYAQSRRNASRDTSTTSLSPPPASVDGDMPSNWCEKDQFSPNSYGFGYELSSMRSFDPRVVSSRSNASGSSSSSSSSRIHTNESAVPASFAHRMEAPRSRPPTTQSLPLLQPRARTPGWTSSPPPSSGRSHFAQYSFPRLTGDARVTMPSAAAVSRSWTTNEFELMDDSSSIASASCDDHDDVFLTGNSAASAFAECDYVDTQTPRGQLSLTAENPQDAVDIYPDTSVTTTLDSGRMFSPLSLRARDTATLQGDVVAEWASLRGQAPDTRRSQQQKIAQWKAKFYQEL